MLKKLLRLGDIHFNNHQPTMKKTTITLLSACMLSFLSFSHGARLPVSQDEQAAMKPGDVLADLMAGNQRYAAGKLSDPNLQARIQAAVSGQYPKAYVLSCVDSRVPVEMVFDQSLGDIFVGRVAGNVENEDQIGSMEFAAKYAGAKLILVLGHESCGAVKGACAGVEDGNLTLLLEKISPAVQSVKGFKAKDRTADNKDFVDQVIQKNVERTVADIRTRSPILAEMEASGKIRIVGGVYSLKSGKVELADS